MIAIVDCGIGNLSSVKNAFDYLKAESMIVGTPDAILDAERIVLPGVGAFGFMMQNLREKGIAEPIRNSIASGKPFLGICLGMQALFEESDESVGVKGLGIYNGKSVRFRKGKVPQIGWNSITPAKKGIFEEDFFYFVNSYYVKPGQKGIIAAVTDYYGEFACAIQDKNVTAVQFHPEKSGSSGIALLQRWLDAY